MGLNMCRQSIVDAPLDLNRELEEFDRTKDRSVLIRAAEFTRVIVFHENILSVPREQSLFETGAPPARLPAGLDLIGTLISHPYFIYSPGLLFCLLYLWVCRGFENV